MTTSKGWTYHGGTGELAARTWVGATRPDHIVLLCHGYGEHIGRYEHVARALVQDSAVVYAVDHMGHGLSAGDRVHIDDFEEVVSDFHLLDLAARSQYPDLPVMLAGHSMGGLIAARYAQLYGATLAAVVLSAPLVGVAGPADALLAFDEIPDIPLDITTLGRDPAVGADYAADPLVWHGPFKRATLLAMREGVARVQKGPSLGELPLLWLHGDGDQLVPMENSRLGIEHLRGTNFEHQTYPGARHEIFNETNRDEVLADLVRYLRSRI